MPTYASCAPGEGGDWWRLVFRRFMKILWGVSYHEEELCREEEKEKEEAMESWRGWVGAGSLGGGRDLGTRNKQDI